MQDDSLKCHLLITKKLLKSNLIIMYNSMDFMVIYEKNNVSDFYLLLVF